LADVNDCHWLHSATIDHQRAGLPLINSGAIARSIEMMKLNRHSKERSTDTDRHFPHHFRFVANRNFRL